MSEKEREKNKFYEATSVWLRKEIIERQRTK